MPIQSPEEGVQALDLFPRYNSRAEYQQKTGKEPPPFMPEQPPKYWEDPAALGLTNANARYTGLELTEIGTPARGEDGRPYMAQFTLPKQLAARVNIPDLEHQILDPFGFKSPVPMPCRALESVEELAFSSIGLPVVRNKVLYQEALEQDPTVQMMLLLKAIAKKLGV